MVHENQLQRETFYLSVHYLDIYLSKKSNVPDDRNFQVIGAVALFLARKMEVKNKLLLNIRNRKTYQ